MYLFLSKKGTKKFQIGALLQSRLKLEFPWRNQKTFQIAVLQVSKSRNLEIYLFASKKGMKKFQIGALLKERIFETQLQNSLVVAYHQNLHQYVVASCRAQRKTNLM